MAVHTVLSLASGAGGLDLGVARALGGRTRTVCYVENEVAAAAVLVARMAEGRLDQAPVWSDLRTFDGTAWRGLVDGIIGGYPCQPFSVAGKQLGAEDPRHLWPHIARIIGAVEPLWCFFENVSNHLRLGGREVISDLQSLGYRTAATLYRAEEVGAPHRRERLFILAYRDGAGLEEFRGAGLRLGALGHDTDGRDAPVGDAECSRWPQAGARAGLDAGSESQAGSGAVGDAYLARLEGRRGALGGGGYQLPAWPPGPTDDARWACVPRELWPATPQPAFRDVADGAPRWLGRADQLRVLGNAVVPAQAKAAMRELIRALN